MKNFVFLLVLVAACSTASVRVMPGESGIHKVLVRDIEKHSAEEEAVEAAEEYCEKKNKEAVFIEDKATTYTGNMDEKTRDTVRKASGAAVILAPAAGIGTNSGGVGGVIGGMGAVGRAMTSGKDYQSELKFKCQ